MIEGVNILSSDDYRYLVIYVNVKWPGGVHNARLFANSSINYFLKSGIMALHAKRNKGV